MKVVVLGAGVIGVTTAWFLRKLGHDVTVLERQPAAALETSWGNGGVIHASEVEPWSQPGMPLKVLKWLGHEDAPLLLRYGALPQMWRWGLAFAANCTTDRASSNSRANLELALYSLRTLQEIGAETGIFYDRAADGVLKIYRSKDSLNIAARGFDDLARYGLIYEVVSAERCAELDPALTQTRGTLAGGLYFPRDEVGDCNKFAYGLAAKAAGKGVVFHYDTAVKDLQVSGGRVTSVASSRGPIAADAVVVAMGSFTAPLLARVGIRVPIYPVKGISITFPRGDWVEAPRMPIIDDSRIFALVPIGDRLRISGSAEITGYDATPSPARAEAIFANAAATFPDLRHHADIRTSQVWAGLRPVSPAGTPIIGQTRIAGLWINSGHGHLGWTLSCGSSRSLADLMSGLPAEISLPGGQGALAA